MNKIIKQLSYFILLSGLIVLLNGCGQDEGYYYDDYDDYYDDYGDETADDFVPAPTRPATAPGDLPRFENGPCPVEVNDDGIECGDLLVAEDRSQSSSPTIRLPVAIIHAGGSAKADPILFLSGGPGEQGLTDPESWREMPFAADRDIIIFDQRGTGHATPSLNCPEMEYESDESDVATARACHDRLVAQGINLAAYNSAASAADVADLRRVLGYEQWNLLGISYGTRLALTIMRDQPEGIRSVLLDSVYPPQINAYTDQALNNAQALEVLFAGCAADPDCNEWYPDLDAVFYELVADLDANPEEVEGDLLDGDTLVNGMIGALYNTDVIPILPLAIYDAYEGYYDTLFQVLDGDVGYRFDDGDDDISDSEGAFYSVECREEVPFDSYAAAEAQMGGYPTAVTTSLLTSVQDMFTICAFWGAGQPPSGENEPVRSAIPTLLFAGQYDPVTPPAWAQAAAQPLSHSYLYIFPGHGHDVIDSGPCGQEIAAQFFNEPTREPDAGCLAEIEGPLFELP